MILAHLGRFADQLLPALQAAVVGEEVVAFSGDGDVPPGGADVLVTLTYDVAGLEQALVASVRWVHVLGAGIDGFPLHAAGDRVITCSRGASAPAISEFVLAAMLSFEKQLPQSWISAPPPQWNVANLGGLRGRTAGIIGLGAIGTAVARRAAAFDMRVIAVRRTATAPAVEGVELVPSLEALLGQSDHVVVAAPSTPETHHLIDHAALAAIKPGAHLINVARGPLVNQDAVLAALDSGSLAMATLDVVDPEPLPAGHPLYLHAKVRLSPHISWSSPDTARRTIELFLENLAHYRAGEALHGVVDTAAGY